MYIYIYMYLQMYMYIGTAKKGYYVYLDYMLQVLIVHQVGITNNVAIFRIVHCAHAQQSNSVVMGRHALNAFR